MRPRWFLLTFLLFVLAVTTALVPLSLALTLRSRAGARGRSIVRTTRRRLAAAGASIVRRFRTATAA